MKYPGKPDGLIVAGIQYQGGLFAADFLCTFSLAAGRIGNPFYRANFADALGRIDSGRKTATYGRGEC